MWMVTMEGDLNPNPEFKWTPMEVFKEVVFRRPIFFVSWLLCLEPEMIAGQGTLKLRFLEWLYGPGTPEFASWRPDEGDHDGEQDQE